MAYYTRGGYHRQAKDWRRDSHRPAGQMAGIELEIEAANCFTEILEALPVPTDKKMAPATEVDGSLRQDVGVEIVFPPFKYSQIRNGNSFFTRALKALENAGATGSYNCGMHVNINTTGWTDGERMAFTAMNSALPHEFLAKVGGRMLNVYCRQYSYVTQVSIETVMGTVSGSHNTVASPRGNRIELRFPAATTDPKKVRLVLDYAHYLEMFVKSREWNPGQTIGANLDTNRTSLSNKAVNHFRNFLNGQKKTAARDRLLALLKGL